MPVASPKTFGKYQILDRIAVGGMAEIFKARLEGEGGFHRIFALKRILPHLTSRPEFVEMLVEEAKIAGLLSHANIVQIMDLGEVSGNYYIAMEFVDGPDMGRILRRCKQKGITLPVPHAVFTCIEVLKALEYAHHRRVMRGGKEVPLDIVHRDVSPANVLVSFQGEVKLTDFGIAKASIKALETVSGIIKGRFDYLAPEQARGDRPDSRADLFTTGVVLYECLTGKHPFRARNEAETLDAIRDGRFEPPTLVNPDVPMALELVLEKALAADPAQRFQTATEMKDALERFFHESGFIFSHSTLAAFLKGLFPDEAGRARRPVEVVEEEDRPTQATVDPGDGPRPVNIETEELLLDVDEPRPTQPAAPARPPPAPDEPFPSMDSTLRRSPRAGLVAAAPDMPEMAPGLVAGLGEEATLIRPQPVHAMSAPEDWDQGETLIKPEPPTIVRKERAARQAAAAPPSPAQARGPDTTHTATLSAPSPRAADPRAAPAARPPAAPATAPRPTSWHVHLLYLGLVAVCSLLMLGVGVAVTRWQLTAGAPPEATVVKNPPQLRVELPEGARLRVDGREVPGPSPIDVVVTASQEHEVEVQMDGRRAYKTRLRLEPNDLRVLSVQWECLPSPP